MESPLGNWFQDMIKRHGDKGCCKECFAPSYDALVGPDYMLAEAMPEGCKDEECKCHLATNSNK